MLTPTMIVRAWKDKEYRDSLSEDLRLTLPEHPAGLIELADEDLEGVSGGSSGPSAATGFVCGPAHIE